jgi:glycerol-3-phosphate dehydrogenase subunit C
LTGLKRKNDYQRSFHAGADEIKVPDRNAGADGFVSLNKSMYYKIMTDGGYFNGLDPLKHMALSDSAMDLCEYLDRQYRKGNLNTRLGMIHDRMVYFTPCHQREQEIGSPYENLLALISGLEIVRVGGAMDFCGMGGSLELKESF